MKIDEAALNQIVKDVYNSKRLLNVRGHRAASYALLTAKERIESLLQHWRELTKEQECKR